MQETGFTKLIVLLATFTEGNMYLLVTVCIHKYLETSQQTTKKNFSMEENWPGGVTSWRFGWGCAAHFWKTLPYFRSKCVIFHTLFQTWTPNLIPYFRPDLTLFRLHKHLRRASTFQPQLIKPWSHIRLHKPHSISDQNGQNLYLISDQKGSKPYPLVPHIPI